MPQETRDTLRKVAQYTDAEKQALKKVVRNISLAASLMLFLYLLLDGMETIWGLPAALFEFFQGFLLGFSMGCSILNTLYLAGVLEKITHVKRRLLGREPS